jgi:hypothetical protein
VKVVLTSAEFEKAAELFKGTDEKDHIYVRESPSTSEQPLPSRVTTEPLATSWSAPALATGAELLLPPPELLPPELPPPQDINEKAERTINEKASVV